MRYLIGAMLVLVACGGNSTGPKTPAPVMETPLLSLPASYRTKDLFQVFSEDLSETGLSHLFVDPATVQFFEYEDLRYRGAIIDFGTRAAATIAFSEAFSEARGDTPVLSELTPFETRQWLGNAQPHLYLVMGRFVLYVASSQDLSRPTQDLTAVNMELARQIVGLNPAAAIVPPFVVDLRVLDIDPSPPTRVQGGANLTIRGQIETALLDVREGEVTVTMTQSRSEVISQTVYPVVGGIDTIIVAGSLDVLRPISETDVIAVTLNVRLSPSYLSGSSTGGDYVHKVGEGEWRHTAGFTYTYRVQP